ncbi:uncharacterized protein N7446_007842 [Penicillium canescens]|uniref:Uncharacterized protein n=1 Tax=Penicillium canescens TaxID=5083 RepID=A0AAD6NDY4_PENCN|nr:uncharacterized protein N7446_007842 [Penicillium canescens]KAJ6056949.1 hypothetical protein N7460_000223 [Penicillium canescens]KAJ6058259.1 hypothetical protein N7446_007842 [Penicillium canescens]
MQYPKGWLAPVGTALLILSTVTQYSDGAAIGTLGSIGSSSSLISTSYATSSLFESGTAATEINHRSPGTKPSAATATTHPTPTASVSLSSSSQSGNKFSTLSRSSQGTTGSHVTSSDHDISSSSVTLTSSSSPSKKLDSSSTASRTTSSRVAKNGSNSSAFSSSAKIPQQDAASATSSKTSSEHDTLTSERSTSRSSDLESTKAFEASSSSSNGASSKASSHATTGTISDAPAVQIVTEVVSGTTEKVPVISDTAESTLITLAPVTTNIATSQATSSASSVSTELAALIPILKSWKKNPTSKKSNTLNKIKDVKNHVEDFISQIGTESSSKGCGSKKKRSALGDLFGDITGSLSCIDKGLDDAIDKVNTNNVNAIDSTVEKLTMGNTNLDNDTENDDSKDKYSKDNDSKDNESKTDDDSSTSEASSNTSKTSSDTSSSTSSCTTHTALHITTKCVPTSKTTGGSTISTTTCTPSTTVTTGGCSVTGLTTTISSSASSTIYPLCASGKCGNGSGCEKYTGPLSGALGATVSTTKTCSSVSTVTTDIGTASFGTFRSVAEAAPTSDSNAAERSSSANENLLVAPLNKRALLEPADYGLHVSMMSLALTNSNAWASQYGGASGTWSDWSTEIGQLDGMNGIYGCTVVFIVSTKGVYRSHIWQEPIFVNKQNEPSPTAYFHEQTFMALRGGVQNEAESLLELIGTKENKGVLHPEYNPQVHVVTPFALDGQTLEYFERAHLLADMLTNLFAQEDTTRKVWGYHRYDEETSMAAFGFLGRTIVEHDPVQFVIMAPEEGDQAPKKMKLQAGGGSGSRIASCGSRTMTMALLSV